MLRYSDDDTATALFTPAAIPAIAARYGLTNTSNATDDPGHWGAARITAADMTRFLYQASVDPEVGPWLLPVMAQTAATGTGEDSDFSQAFGLNAISGTHGSKQGWGCDSYWTDPQCVIGSVGYTAGAFVAILQLGDGYPDPMRATATEAASVIARATTAVLPVRAAHPVRHRGQRRRRGGRRRRRPAAWLPDRDRPAGRRRWLAGSDPDRRRRDHGFRLGAGPERLGRAPADPAVPEHRRGHPAVSYGRR
jgi:hypothetical protein